MPKNLKNQLKVLVQLQHIETQTDAIQQILDRSPAKIKALEERLAEYGEKVQDQDSMLDRLRKEYRDYETESQITLSNIKKSTEKLSSVKTNKEYQSSLKEIEDLKKKNSQIEDNMIQHLEKIEELEQGIESFRTEYDEASKKVKAEKAMIEAENEKSRQKLSALTVEWNEISEKVDPKLLHTYNLVKERRSKMAIAGAIKAVCQGCNMNIPPQMYNDLQRFDKLQFCPHCQRIIYWEKEEAKV